MKIGSFSCEELVSSYGSPLYVIDEARIRENYGTLSTPLTRLLPSVRIHYAVKANTNLSVLKILASCGAHFDVVSLGEALAVLRVGVPAERILFTGTSVRTDEMKALTDKHVRINFDSIEQFERYVRDIGSPSFASFRVNIDFGAGHHSHCITSGCDTKFGVWDYLTAYRTAQRVGVERFGLHTHIGSGIRDYRILVEAARRLLKVAGELKKKLGISFEFIDFGGGFGIPYKPNDTPFAAKSYARAVSSLFTKACREYDLGTPAFAIEPGRFLVADAVFLLTTVNTVKKTPYHTFVGVDAGFHTLIRPAMYGSYHHILVNGKERARAHRKYTVAGPLCESGDVFCKDRPLPPIEEGDILIIKDAGAYGFSMSSTYNSRPRPAEVLINGDKKAVVRERETIDDLFARQTIAPWL